MKKYIAIDKEMREKLMKIFGCSRVWVWKALNYENDTPKCMKIRMAALKMGGHVVGDDTALETSYESSEGIMIQKFGPRVRLIVDIAHEDGEYEVEIDGTEWQRGSAKMSIPEFMKMQESVDLMAKSL